MIKKITLNPPAIKQNGDTFQRDGKYLNQVRNGAVVQTWNLSAMQSEPVNELQVNGSVIESVFLEQGMSGQNTALTRVTIGASGQVGFVFSSGASLEYPTWDSIADIANQYDQDPTLAMLMIIAKSYRNDPAGVNKGNFVGGQCSINLDADQPIVFTAPE